MTQILAGSELNYEVLQTTTFLFKIVAARTQRQRVMSEGLNFDPLLSVEDYPVGPEGNRLHRVVVDPCILSVRYEVEVELSPNLEPTSNIGETAPSQMPADVLTYMNPSRYCESDVLGRFAYDEFGQLAPGYARVQAICDWVTQHLEYAPGSTGPTTTATDVLLQRTGVCRDYAHLMISLCRGVGIPARYVSGYAVDLQPADYHGFVEAFLGGQWYLFDPTQLASTRGLVRIGVGRDAADVAFATLTGSAVLNQKSVWANFSQSTPSNERSTGVSTA